MKTASWNVNSLRLRLPQVLAWLGDARPDFLVLQETKVTDDLFPLKAIEDAGYHAGFSGQKSYNGVALLSRHPISDLETDVVNLEDPQRRILAATVNGVRVINLYVPNGSEVGSEKYAYKLDWLAKIHAYLKCTLEQYPQVLVMGDFNIAPDDRDVHNPDLWRDKILCSVPERDAFRAFLELGFSDSFRLFAQAEKVFSWWDYRQAGFRRNFGLRIDHILASAPLSACCVRCWIDTGPRKLEKPSDHAPVIAEFSLT